MTLEGVALELRVWRCVWGGCVLALVRTSVRLLK